MRHLGMIVDVTRCIGCYNCFLACRDEHAGNDHRPLAAPQAEHGPSWIEVRVHERGAYPKVKVSYVPAPCQHCADAPCMQAAVPGSIYRRDDGIVIIDPARAAGQRDIVSACPHRAIVWNEELGMPQKCTFCAHLLDDGWREPRCVEACPTGALLFGDPTDPASEISRRRATASVESLQPAHGGASLVCYIGLPRRFVAGEVVFADRIDAPAPGVLVTLHQAGRTIKTETDAFGDFEFDGLEADAHYVLSARHAGYRTIELALVTRNDLNVGTLVLDPIASEGER